MITRETTKQLIATAGIFSVVAIIAGYSYFTSYGIIDGPNISIKNPASPSEHGTIYAVSTSSSIIISGVATRVSSLSLDGRPIVIDPQGNFSEMMLLFPGYNLETLAGQDKFGRMTTVTLSLVDNGS